MYDQVIIGDVASLDDYDASMAEREISEPKKKSIKETVPFSNQIYDFTKINGEAYWEERILKYVFEITANSPEELEDKKMLFKSWIMNVHEEKLKDPYIFDYHFLATFDDISCDDSEIEKSTITVTFTAYPYLIADNETVFTYDLEAEVAKTVMIANRSSHRITPTIVSDIDVTITMGDSSYAVGSGETTDSTFMLEAGITTLTLSSSDNGTIAFRFFEEVF